MLEQLADPRGSVVGMAISADGRTLATVTRHHELSETYQLHLWNLKTGQQTITLFEHEHMLEDLSFTASNTLSARTSFGDSNRRGLLLFETSPQSK